MAGTGFRPILSLRSRRLHIFCRSPGQHRAWKKMSGDLKAVTKGEAFERLCQVVGINTGV
jgi:fatty acid-binding protein DegV